MNELAFFYSVRSELPVHPEDPASLGAKFLKTLDALSDIDPIFADWQIMDYPARDSFPLAMVRPRMAAAVEKNAKRDDCRHPHPEWGYSLGAYTEATDPTRSMHLRISAGGVKPKGDTYLELGSLDRLPTSPP